MNNNKENGTNNNSAALSELNYLQWERERDYVYLNDLIFADDPEKSEEVRERITKIEERIFSLKCSLGI